jgi:glutamate dehydrogenase (NAD(P)+)
LDAGFNIVAVSDASATLRHKQKLPVAEILKATEPDQGGEHKSLSNVEVEADKLERDDLLEVDCDVLIPAAVGGAIHRENADKIAAKNVVEAANLPVTCAADEILFNGNVTIIPDILANAGGVITSYLEWAQNRQRYWWSRRRVLGELEDILRAAWDGTREVVEKEETSYRAAAYRIAVERVLRAMRLRGF